MKEKLTWDLSKLFKNKDEFYEEIEKIRNDVSEFLKSKESKFDADTLLKY